MDRPRHAFSVLQAAFVIARRDYSATVLSKTFLFFLIGPLFPILLGTAFGSIGSQMARQGQTARVAVIAADDEYALLERGRDQALEFGSQKALTEIVRAEPEEDRAAQRRRLLASETSPIVAVLDSDGDSLFEEPRMYGSVGVNTWPVRHVNGYIARALVLRELPEPPSIPLRLEPTRKVTGTTHSNRIKIAQAGQFALFFLTLLLATMLLSQMLEEKGNKVIEVLASAVPVDGIFVGKLFAMLAVSLTGIVIWLSIGIGLYALASPQGLSALPPPPAVGWPLFFLFVLVYFAMGYLLVGAAFLGIGAQATTPRQVQVMSMPVTMLQVMLLFAAMQGVGDPGGEAARIAAIFPLTSSLAMIARAAEEPTLWTHAAALFWQALWIALFLKLASRAFRRSVLKTGTKGWFSRRKAAAR